MTRPSPVLFVTASSPMSHDEPFVQDEITQLIADGCEAIVAPIRRLQPAPNAAAAESGLAAHVRSESLMSLRVLAGAMRTLLRHPARSARCLTTIVRTSGSTRNLQNNLLSFPKALWLANLARRTRARHIHAYWLGHSTTAAMVAATIARLPWSATGYRWDIDAANCFGPKFASARFLRCADEMGFEQMTAFRSRLRASTPIHLVRTGVPIPPLTSWDRAPVDVSTICCAGTFVEKKGQTYLLEAVARLRECGASVHLDLFGEGPFETELRERTAALQLEDAVSFRGMVALAELRAALRRRPILVLPSIITPDGQQEGIPVVLIEAMANGAPVISTTTGSIGTLVTSDCGLLVPPADVDALVAALADTIARPDLAGHRAHAAYERVFEEFSLVSSAAKMRALMLGQQG